MILFDPNSKQKLQNNFYKINEIWIWLGNWMILRKFSNFVRYGNSIVIMQENIWIFLFESHIETFKAGWYDV